MRKTRAIILLVATVVLLAGYVAWAVWEPAPTLQSMMFYPNVDADARSAAEADFRAHPPTAHKLNLQRLWNRLATPYQSRGKPPVTVICVSSQDGRQSLLIYYPDEWISLTRSSKQGSWQRSPLAR